MDQHCIVLQNRLGTFTQLQLFESIENTNWGKVTENASSSSRKVYSLADAKLLRVSKEKYAADIEDIVSLLSDSVFCIIGLLMRRVKLRTAVFYIIMFPSDDVKNLRLYLIQKHRSTTNSIDRHMHISDIIKNNQECKDWKYPHELICDILLPDVDDKNPFCYQLFVPWRGYIQLMGNMSLKDEASKIFEYNRLTGKLAVNVLSVQQLKRKMRDKKAKTSSPSSTSVTGSVTLTDCVYQALKVSDDYDAYLKERGVAGIRSFDSGGRVSLHPLLIDKDSAITIPAALSEMHIVTTIKDVFSVNHTHSTLVAAIDLFQRNCNAIGLEKGDFETVLANVASLLLEDLSWKIVAEDSCEQLLKTIKVDIDQVLLSCVNCVSGY
jgi:hypothetical protein